MLLGSPSVRSRALHLRMAGGVGIADQFEKTFDELAMDVRCRDSTDVETKEIRGCEVEF